MKKAIHTEFSDRLNKVADILKIPPFGKNRQAAMGKMFGVSQEAARKWLSGESLPQLSTAIEIANKANVSIDWLLLGKESYNIPIELSSHLRVMQNLPDYAKTEVIRHAINTSELIAKAQSDAKQSEQ